MLNVIDEMPNAALLEHVAEDDNATDVELELAERLRQAIDEIEILVATVHNLRAEHGDGA